MTLDDGTRQWFEQQLPGLEDEVLWEDITLVVSIPCTPRPGLTNKVNVRYMVHENYLEWGKRTRRVDQTTGISLTALPAAMDDALDQFIHEVWTRLNPFI